MSQGRSVEKRCQTHRGQQPQAMVTAPPLLFDQEQQQGMSLEDLVKQNQILQQQMRMFLLQQQQQQQESATTEQQQQQQQQQQPVMQLVDGVVYTSDCILPEEGEEEQRGEDRPKTPLNVDAAAAEALQGFMADEEEAWEAARQLELAADGEGTTTIVTTMTTKEETSVEVAAEWEDCAMFVPTGLQEGPPSERIVTDCDPSPPLPLSPPPPLPSSSSSSSVSTKMQRLTPRPGGRGAGGGKNLNLLRRCNTADDDDGDAADGEEEDEEEGGGCSGKGDKMKKQRARGGGGGGKKIQELCAPPPSQQQQQQQQQLVRRQSPPVAVPVVHNVITTTTDTATLSDAAFLLLILGHDPEQYRLSLINNDRDEYRSSEDEKDTRIREQRLLKKKPSGPRQKEEEGAASKRNFRPTVRWFIDDLSLNDYFLPNPLPLRVWLGTRRALVDPVPPHVPNRLRDLWQYDFRGEVNAIFAIPYDTRRQRNEKAQRVYEVIKKLRKILSLVMKTPDRYLGATPQVALVEKEKTMSELTNADNDRHGCITDGCGSMVKALCYQCFTLRRCVKCFQILGCGADCEDERGNPAVCDNMTSFTTVTFDGNPPPLNFKRAALNKIHGRFNWMDYYLNLRSRRGLRAWEFELTLMLLTIVNDENYVPLDSNADMAYYALLHNFSEMCNSWESQKIACTSRRCTNMADLAYSANPNGISFKICSQCAALDHPDMRSYRVHETLFGPKKQKARFDGKSFAATVLSVGSRHRVSVPRGNGIHVELPTPPPIVEPKVTRRPRKRPLPSTSVPVAMSVVAAAPSTMTEDEVSRAKFSKKRLPPAFHEKSKAGFKPKDDVEPDMLFEEEREEAMTTAVAAAATAGQMYVTSKCVDRGTKPKLVAPSKNMDKKETD